MKFLANVFLSIFAGLSAEFASMLLVVLVGGFTLIGGLGEPKIIYAYMYYLWVEQRKYT